MRSDMERASSSFRGGFKSKCNCSSNTDDVDSVSSFSTMIPSRAWLETKNFRNMSAADLANREGHIALGTLILNTCEEVYSRSFVDLQIHHMLQKSGTSLSLAASSIIEGCAVERRTTIVDVDNYDEQSFSANYSLALITDGSILGEYEQEKCIIDVDIQFPLRPPIQISSPETESSVSMAPSIIRPVDISVLPEHCSSTVQNVTSSNSRNTRYKPLVTKNGNKINMEMALSLGISEEEYLEMASTGSNDMLEKERCVNSNDCIAVRRHNSSIDVSLKSLSNGCISLKRSLSDSRLQLNEYLKKVTVGTSPKL